MFSVESMIYAWDNQLRYAQALVADLSDEQFVLRPGGNMNHPAWILGARFAVSSGDGAAARGRTGGRSEKRSAVWICGAGTGG